jgi:hypothetical protein
MTLASALSSVAPLQSPLCRAAGAAAAAFMPVGADPGPATKVNAQQKQRTMVL